MSSSSEEYNHTIHQDTIAAVECLVVDQSDGDTSMKWKGPCRDKFPVKRNVPIKPPGIPGIPAEDTLKEVFENANAPPDGDDAAKRLDTVLAITGGDSDAAAAKRLLKGKGKLEISNSKDTDNATTDGDSSLDADKGNEVLIKPASWFIETEHTLSIMQALDAGVPAKDLSLKTSDLTVGVLKSLSSMGFTMKDIASQVDCTETLIRDKFLIYRIPRDGKPKEWLDVSLYEGQQPNIAKSRCEHS